MARAIVRPLMPKLLLLSYHGFFIGGHSRSEA